MNASEIYEEAIVPLVEETKEFIPEDVSEATRVAEHKRWLENPWTARLVASLVASSVSTGRDAAQSSDRVDVDNLTFRLMLVKLKTTNRIVEYVTQSIVRTEHIE